MVTVTVLVTVLGSGVMVTVTVLRFYRHGFIDGAKSDEDCRVASLTHVSRTSDYR